MLDPRYHNSIICWDSLEVMSAMPSACVDLIITSPPYNIRGKAKSAKHSKYPSLAKLHAEGYNGYTDDLPDDEYIAWQRKCVVEMMRILKPTGALFYNHKYHPAKLRMRCYADDIMQGFNLRQRIIWDRRGSNNFNHTFFGAFHEYIYFVANEECRLSDGATSKGDIWSMKAERDRTAHPAPFPIELPLRCIESVPCEVVLDPFCGSGTTCLAAQQMGKTYIGIELSQEYCDIAKQRLARSE